MKNHPVDYRRRRDSVLGVLRSTRANWEIENGPRHAHLVTLGYRAVPGLPAGSPVPRVLILRSASGQSMLKAEAS